MTAQHVLTEKIIRQGALTLTVPWNRLFRKVVNFPSWSILKKRSEKHPLGKKLLLFGASSGVESKPRSLLKGDIFF